VVGRVARVESAVKRIADFSKDDPEAERGVQGMDGEVVRRG